MENLEIIESSGGVEIIEAQQRAEFDIQISTAKRYPRDLVRIKNNCIAVVAMDKETAESCRYALPRGGKTLSGPSVHLARIIAQQYGNIRVDARIKQVTDKQVISEAVCFDLETNYACKVEVRRSISGKNGRFNDDMITVTGNASNSIAFRNAVLNVIPKGITDIVYKAAIQTITGDLSDETKLIKSRNAAVQYFKDTYNVNEKQLLAAMGLNSVNQIKSEQIADMKGMIQSLKDGDSTVSEMFDIPIIQDNKKADAKKVYKNETEINEDLLKNAITNEQAEQFKLNLK